MSELVYLRMKKNANFPKLTEVLLKDIAFVSTTNPSLKKKLENLLIYRLTKKDKNLVVIDSFLIIEYITKQEDEVEVQLLGPNQTVIRVIEEDKRYSSILLVTLVWIILFIGTSMTIMNFHYDVSMQQVQQKLHLLLTGVENEFPLWIQIPYSIGLGLGTLLFFNHWFNKRFNEEPSPLEIEIFKYQQDLDNYLNYKENEFNARDVSK